MTTFEKILKNFYFEPLNGGNKFPKFGKSGSRQEYLFTCKRCGSQSEPMNFHQDLKYRLGSHLARYCHSYSNASTKEEEVNIVDKKWIFNH